MKRRLPTTAAIVLALLAIVSCACSEVTTRFTPYSAATARPRPLVAHAVRVYEGDATVLQNAGAEMIGTLEVTGEPYEDLLEPARLAGARRGGTHVVLRKRTDVFVAGSSPGAPGALAATLAPTVSVELERQTYSVVRVPPERWGELPVTIRPVPGVPPPPE